MNLSNDFISLNQEYINLLMELEFINLYNIELQKITKGKKFKINNYNHWQNLIARKRILFVDFHEFLQKIINLIGKIKANYNLTVFQKLKISDLKNCCNFNIFTRTCKSTKYFYYHQLYDFYCLNLKNKKNKQDHLNFLIKKCEQHKNITRHARNRNAHKYSGIYSDLSIKDLLIINDDIKNIIFNISVYLDEIFTKSAPLIDQYQNIYPDMVDLTLLGTIEQIPWLNNYPLDRDMFYKFLHILNDKGILKYFNSHTNGIFYSDLNEYYIAEYI